MALDGQKICDCYMEQKTLLDKVMFLYNLEVYTQQLESIRDLLRDDKLSEEEKEQLPIKDLKQIRADLKILQEVDEEIMKNLSEYANESVENRKEYMAVNGMVKAHFVTELGQLREQQEQNDLLFKDDKRRKQKLNYICIHMDGQPEKEFSQLTNGALASAKAGLKDNALIPKTGLNNIDHLKRMTMKQYIEDFKLDNIHKDNFKRFGEQFGIANIDEANAYDFFSELFKGTGDYQDSYRANPEKTNENFDKNLLSFINSHYIETVGYSSVNFGAVFYKTTLDADGLRQHAIGEKLNGIPEKGDSLSAEEGREVTPIVDKGQVQRIKNCAESAKQVLFSEKPLDMEKKKPFNEIFLPVNKNQKSYDTYIKLHSGMNALKSKESFQSLFTKCLAAEALKAENKKFDIKLIHRAAKNIEDLPTFKALSQDEIVAAMAKPSELEKMQKRFVREALGVNENNRENYKNSMQALKNNMKSKEGRSTEYQNLYDAVDAVANLDLDNNGEQFTAANKRLLLAVKNYIKGKEKVRTSQGGKDRFDNAMDALSIMYQNVPGLKRTIEGMISGVNSKRNVKEGDAKFVRLGNYGAERAAERKQQIEAAKNQGHKKAAVDPAKTL